jgi:pyroglutamyl-peptidase
VVLLCLAAVVSLGLHRTFGDPVRAEEESAPQPGGKAAAERPVILLTGFEPFGKKRPPNASWEGIKQLDGREWKGYRLVCKQLPVVWGAPMEQLPAWIDEHRPVAVFSFGESESKDFELESKAVNERRKEDKKGRPVEDNLGKVRPRPQVVEDGPGDLPSSTDCAKLLCLLAEKGYPIRVSDDAGRYLCNEALYTLEYLKSSKKLEATVLFCHVPELGRTVRGKPVTAEYVGQFVQDLLEAWRQVYEKTRDPRYQEVKEMIARYFRTWSEQDIDGYSDCFLPEACIQYLDAPGAGRLSTSAKAPFIASQREYHRRSPHKTVEAPERIDVRFEENLARAVVHWKLTAGPRTEYGFDHFTLMKHGGKWRIVNLVFYTTPR